MKISYEERSTFLVRYIDHRNPRLNGFTAVGIYGLKISKLKIGQSIKKIDLYLCAADYKLKGEPVKGRTIAHEKGPILQIAIPPKQAMLVGWVNMQDFYMKPAVEGSEIISCSGLFVFRTIKRKVLNCNSLLINLFDSNDELYELMLPISAKSLSAFKDGNQSIHNF